MNEHQPFVLYDCGLARLARGVTCATLEELLHALQASPDAVLEHHLMRCVLEDHFELHEFPNDLARWCWDSLGDHAFGEQLGLVDPYRHATMASLRETITTMIAERIREQEVPLACRDGLELHLIESRLIAYRTDERFTTPVELAEAVPRFTLPSLFFHVHEARRRSGDKSDDLSQWLEDQDADAALVAAIRGLDFYFLNLRQLRDELVRVFRGFMPDAPAVGVAA